MRNSWSAPTDWLTVCRRAAGRRKYHALRRLRACLRRREVLRLLGEWGWTYGVQARLSRHLGVSRATICRDVQMLLPLVEPCPTCGMLQPRDWWDKT